MNNGESTQRINLTTPIIRGIEPPESGRVNVYDAKTPGLLVQVTAKGTRSFYVYRRVRGRPPRTLLGNFPAMTWEQAGEKAVAIAAKIIDGDDPKAEKRAARSALTLGEVFDHFHETRSVARGSTRTATSHKSRFDTCWK